MKNKNKLESTEMRETQDITFYDSSSGYPYDREYENPDLKRKGNPKLISAVLRLKGENSGDIIIANTLIGGSVKNGYLEHDLALRYRPSHFSWRGCYNHYFLNGKFTGDIRRTETNGMYSKELSSYEERINSAELSERHVKSLRTLVKALELKTGKRLVDEKELRHIWR